MKLNVEADTSLRCKDGGWAPCRVPQEDVVWALSSLSYTVWVSALFPNAVVLCVLLL